MKIALTRDVSPAITQCELTHLDRTPIDFDRANQQHAAYCDVLAELGWTVIRLPTSNDLPDSVFVEDTAVVTEEIAIQTNPGAVSRRLEVAPVVELVEKFRNIEIVRPPATLDGGDVLIVEKNVWVGVGERTNRDGFETLRGILQPHRYKVQAAETRNCLHLKTAVTYAGARCMILNPKWIDVRNFSGWHTIEVDPSEPFAANTLRLGDVTLISTAYPKTRSRLEAQGINCRAINMTELAKAEGGLTCCSILFDI